MPLMKGKGNAASVVSRNQNQQCSRRCVVKVPRIGLPAQVTPAQQTVNAGALTELSEW